MKRQLARRRKGIVMLMFAAMMLFVLCPVVGLAIDVGIAYAAKARLQSASDGAALAASRSLGRGISPSDRMVVASETAQRFFAANLRDGWLGISSPVATVTFPAAPPKTTVVKVDTTVQLATYFLRMLGSPSMTLRTVSASSRRDVNIMIVLDRSGSMAASGSCEPMKEAAKSFVLTFQEGRDKIGLITFGTTYNVDKKLRSNYRTSGTDIITVIDNINCTGYTNAASAYSLAYDQLVAANESGVLNVILFFTDGMPNTITMPRIQMSGGGACAIKGNRYGVIAANNGIYEAVSPSLPPVLNDQIVIANNAGCAFAPAADMAGLQSETVALTRSAADGDAGNSNGDGGNSVGGGDGNGHGQNVAGGARWNNWPGDQDAFGNSLNGFKPVTTDGSGRITMDPANILNGGINALTNAAARVRSDSAIRGLDVFTYVIGLGAFGTPDTIEILDRMANVTTSPVHDPSKPIGLSINPDVAGELEAAFALVASELLRLSM